MIPIADAFRWLNAEKPSQLSERSSFSIWQIQDARVDDAERNAILESLVHCSHDLPNLLEQAEIMASCALVRLQSSHREEARRLMLESFRIYNEQKDRHRQAVVEWCLFIIRRMLLEYGQAFSHARSARQLFLDQAAEYVSVGEREAQRIRWYRDRIADMTCDLVLTPEETYEWLNMFKGSRLNAVAIQLRDRIRKDIQDKCFEEAYNQMETLRKMTLKSIDPIETAEALAFCGLSMTQMGNRSESIKYLRMALANAIPASHEHTAIRWMLGLVQFGMLSERNKGINNLEDCQRYFEELRNQADRRNNQNAVRWYETQLEAMRRGLKDFARSEA